MNFFLDEFGIAFGKRFTAEYIANETVITMLNNRRNQHIPSSSSIMKAVL